MQKNVFFISISLLISWLTATCFSQYLPIATLTGTAVCTDNSQSLYLDQDNNTDTYKDRAFFLADNIKFNYTKTGKDYHAVLIFQNNDPTNQYNSVVHYYSSEDGMIMKKAATWAPVTIDNQTFARRSRVFPYNTNVRGIDTRLNKIVLQQPKSLSKNRIISLVYSYLWTYATGFAAGTSNYGYNKVDTGFVLPLTTANYIDWKGTSRTWSPTLAWKNNCINLNLHRCGDGQIDAYARNTWRTFNFTNEICDSGAKNSNITTWACNLACTGFVGGWVGPKVCSTDPTIAPDQIACDNGVANNGNDEKCTLTCEIEVTIIPDLIRDEL